MKVKPAFLVFGCAAVLLCGAPIVTRADNARTEAARDPAKEKRTFSGAVTAVDAAEKTVSVKRMLVTKVFNLGDNCALIVGDKKNAKLDDFRAGNIVRVSYDEVLGVLVARQIEKGHQTVTGYVEAVDPKEQLLKVKAGTGIKNFTLAEDCKLAANGDKEIKLAEVKAGNRVSVLYEVAEGVSIAHRVECVGESFSGTVTAIDQPARTVKVKSFLVTKKFNLAGDCRIVINGGARPASLKELRIGQPVTITYEGVDGVNVAHRVAQETKAAAAADEPEAARPPKSQ